MQNFIIEKLFYVRAQEQNPVYNKPYTVNITGDDVHVLCDIMRHSNKTQVDTAILASSGINPVTYSAASNPTAIDKNWVTTPRYIFLLKVSYVDMLGNKQNIYVQGYTDYDGISASGSIDPQLVHYVNSVIETTEYSINSPVYGFISKENIRNIHTVINNYRSRIETVFTQRPSDLFSNVNAQNLAGMISASEHYGSYIENRECSINNMETRSISSNIENNIATRYICTAINAGINSITEAELSYVDNFHNPVVEAGSFVKEGSLISNSFIRDINRREGTVPGTPFFMFRSLAFYDPTVSDRAYVIQPNDHTNPILSNTPTSGEYWHGQDIVTMKAYAYIEQLTAMIMRYGLTKLYFDFSYAGEFEGPQVVVYDFNSYINNISGMDVQKLVDMTVQNIKNEVIVPESMRGMMRTSASCYIDIFNISKIYLAIDGFPPSWFTMPSFAGSLFSPVVTVDKSNFDVLSSSIYSLSDTIVNSTRQV